MQNWGKALVSAIFFAFIAGLAALLNAIPWTNASYRSLFLLAASFCCFGFLLGGIYAFDPVSDLKIKASSFGRILFGVAAGLILSCLWRWPADGTALAATVGAMLGYFGMFWAKYVDF